MRMSLARYGALTHTLRYILLVSAMVGLTACGGGTGATMPVDIPPSSGGGSNNPGGGDSGGSAGGGDTGVDNGSDTDSGDTGGNTGGGDTGGATDSGDAGGNTGGSTASTLTVSWEQPLTNVDGSPLNDLAGYRVYWGTAPGVYTQSAQVNDPAAISYSMATPAPGTYYFATTAYDAQTNEGPHSNVATIVIN